jgi:hypothetical protein
MAVDLLSLWLRKRHLSHGVFMIVVLTSLYSYSYGGDRGLGAVPSDSGGDGDEDNEDNDDGGDGSDAADVVVAVAVAAVIVVVVVVASPMPSSRYFSSSCLTTKALGTSSGSVGGCPKSATSLRRRAVVDHGSSWDRSTWWDGWSGWIDGLNGGIDGLMDWMG